MLLVSNKLQNLPDRVILLTKTVPIQKKSTAFKAFSVNECQSGLNVTSKAQILAEQLGITCDHASWMLTNNPDVLEADPSSVQKKLSMLSSVFACSMTSVAALVTKQPTLLNENPSRIRKQLTYASSELEIPRPKLVAAARRVPAILTRKTSELRACLQQIAELLQQPYSSITRIVNREPALLVLDINASQARFNWLKKHLTLSEFEVCKVLLNCPSIFTLSTSSIESKIANLQEVFRTSTLAGVGKVICKTPSLLNYSSKHITEQFNRLSEATSCKRAHEMIARKPSILVRSASSLTAKIVTVTGLVSGAQSTLHFERGQDGGLAADLPRRVGSMEGAFTLATIDATSNSLFPTNRSPLLSAYGNSNHAPTAASATSPQHIAIERQSPPFKALVTASIEPDFPEGAASHASKNGATHASNNIVSHRPSNATTSTKSSCLSAASVIVRRPELLEKSCKSLNATYKALSIWRLSDAEKSELLSRHPLILRLSPKEVHLRCRWLRTFILSNGYYHAVLRRLPLALLGIVLMHLPTGWSRLQYLAESGQEAALGLMDTVQWKAPRFAAKFVGYAKWHEWKVAEMRGQLPWRCEAFRQAASRQWPTKTRHPSRRGDKAGSNGPASKLSPSDPQQQNTVLHEAVTVLVGGKELTKPKRICSEPAPVPKEIVSLPAAALVTHSMSNGHQKPKLVLEKGRTAMHRAASSTSNGTDPALTRSNSNAQSFNEAIITLASSEPRHLELGKLAIKRRNSLPYSVDCGGDALEPSLDCDRSRPASAARSIELSHGLEQSRVLVPQAEVGASSLHISPEVAFCVSQPIICDTIPALSNGHATSVKRHKLEASKGSHAFLPV